jgi:hypothetical protein
MTLNPNAGQSAPDTFRDEGLYAFRFDLDRDAREELSFKERFGAAIAGFNGRGLAEDVMDAMLTLVTNKPLSDEVAPDRSRMRDEFPYFGAAFASVAAR